MAGADKINLALSGGGLRATFYSLGVMRRLVELGLWDKVESIDSVSGGSFAAAQVMIALSAGPFKDVADFDRRVILPLKALGQSRFRERISLPALCLIALVSLAYAGILSFFRIPLLIELVLYVWLLFLIRPAKLFSLNYLQLLDRFFKKEYMRQLPVYPVWRVNATCLNTGKQFIFKQDCFGGEMIGFTRDNDVKIAFAVAASAAPPPVFSPYRLALGKKDFSLPGENFPRPKRVFLCDGGIYDNLGAETILAEKNRRGRSFIIVDAGQYIPRWFPNLNPNSLVNPYRMVETAVDQIILLKRKLLSGTQTQADMQCLPGTILALEEPVSSYLSSRESVELPQYDIYPEKIDKMIAGLRTDLDGFHDVEIDLLLWAGSIRTDIVLKRCFKNSLSALQFNSTPAKPGYPLDRIERILSRGRKFAAPLGFLHKNLKRA